jgi:hypothetical protein
MKTYIEVLIASTFNDDNDFICVIRNFATNNEQWQFLEEESEDYTMHVGEPSCALLYLNSQYEPLVAISKNNERFYIANIVPKETGRIPMSEYNNISVIFADAFSKYIKTNALPLSIKTTKEEIGIEDIIPGKKTRRYFENYMGLFPTSYHFNDIRRLDTFICAVSRYSRTPMDVDMLKGYLIGTKGWAEKDAEWCVNRIRTGLEVLETNRRF